MRGDPVTRFLYFPIESEPVLTFMTDDEQIQLAAERLEGRVVPYWKLKHPPKLSELKASMQQREDRLERTQQLTEYAQEVKARKYWEKEAQRVCATRATKNEIRNAMSGVTHSDTLTQQLKECLKRAK